MHFFVFVAHKLDFAPLLYYFAYCNKALDISVKYGEMFLTLIEDPFQDTNYEKWYYEQVDKLIEGTFSLDEVRNRVLNGERNTYIEKLLVGLLGWNDKTA
mgnify:CR=1 FL=1